MGIDRRALIGRHAVQLRRPDAQNPLTVGTGDFGYTADITGMQTFRDFHDPLVAEAEGRLAVNTCTMSTWGWHEMPNPRGFALDDAMTEYDTPRGPVSYPDRFDISSMTTGIVSEEFAAGTWLHVNPQRIDLGRIGLRLRDQPDGAVEQDPATLSETFQQLDLWTGSISSEFAYAGQKVRVQTLAHPDRSLVAFRIASPLLADSRLAVGLSFAYPSDLFHQPNDWNREDAHRSALDPSAGGAVVRRTLDGTSYTASLSWDSGSIRRIGNHEFELATDADTLELVVEFAPSEPAGPRPSFDEVGAAAAEHWQGFWESGAAVDFAGTPDPRAAELERRIVLSQYLTAVNCSGLMPPQETGLVTNSWQGKAHLEMHWWHAAHFAAWGRPHLLERSIAWYESIAPMAKATAERQRYEGLRWPKQIGPDGRESPTDIGALLIWQQPHLLYFAELLHRSGQYPDIVPRLAPLVHGTAAFMASFVEERDGVFHLPSPLVPAQEFYDSRSTADPTFELGYWWWGLEIANRWRERLGQERHPHWDLIQDHLARPHTVEGIYAAIGTPPYLRRDDHPSMLALAGMLPESPLADRDTMVRTIRSVLEDWDWDSAWGWDFPVLAMAATRAGEPGLAVHTLLLDAQKNQYLPNGHNPQMGNFLPIYLPGNGGLLSAVSLMVAGWDGSAQLPGFPAEWRIRHEGFLPWPSHQPENLQRPAAVPA